MKSFLRLALSGCVLAVGLPAYAAVPDPDTAKLECDLTGDCASNTTDAAPDADAAAPANPGRGKPRGGAATRGFTFQRQATPGTSAVAPTAVAQAAPRRAAPAAYGAANLNLSFVSGSAILTEPAKARLARYASVLAGPKFGTRRLRIEGYTDASGSPVTNQDLSRRRAQTVADFLSAAGVARTRLEVVGYGSSRLLPNVAPTAPENRRVMAVLL